MPDGTVPANGASQGDDQLRQLASGLVRLVDAARFLVSADDGPNELARRIESHLGVSPLDLPVVSQQLPWYQLVDVQVAVDQWVQEVADRRQEVIGIRGQQQRRFSTFVELLTSPMSGLGLGPVEYADVPDSPDSTRRCIQFGVFLLSDGDARVAMLLRKEERGPVHQIGLELIAADPAVAEDVLAELRQLTVRYSVLRGQVLSLVPGEGPEYGGLRFIRRPELARLELVLPEPTLNQVERHVIGVAQHRDRLRAAGQHLKRGLLLYGPPGTGKTHTVRYLLSQLHDVTAFILSGQGLRLVGQACALARLLEPSLVVLEDVDLIAADRSFGPMGNPLLFEVLNQIDGLGEDVDVTFLLTTNRVDILERALSERPGRVDVAVEIGPPDEEGRRRLFRLYGRGVGVDVLSDEELAGACAATGGRTATYVREVVRRAAMQAVFGAGDAEGSGGDAALRVNGDLLEQAAIELLADRSALTRSLLDGPQEPDAEPPITGPGAPMMGWRGMGPGKRFGPPPPFGGS